METHRRLDIPGARGIVDVDGVLGLTFRVRIDGIVVRRSRGQWAIPLRSGSTATVTANGIIPGFQTIYVDGEPALRLGAHVEPAAKAAMFSPALLLVWPMVVAMPPVIVLVGSVLAVVMFLMNVVTVKNPQLPRGIRVAMPVINTVILLGVLLLIFGLRF